MGPKFWRPDPDRYGTIDAKTDLGVGASKADSFPAYICVSRHVWKLPIIVTSLSRDFAWFTVFVHEIVYSGFTFSHYELPFPTPLSSRSDLVFALHSKFCPSARDEHGSGLDRTGSGLKPILAGSGLDRTAIFLKIGGSGPDRTEKIFVVLMWLFWKYQKFLSWTDFTGLLNGSVYFAIKCKNSAGTILQFELYPPLFTYNVEF